jgi:hypothetical protein
MDVSSAGSKGSRMNNTHWVGLALCLTAVGCRFPMPCRQLAPPHSCVSHSDEVDCSGIPGEAPMASVPVAPRLPYGYRWNDYQGADIEHDIYGDRSSGPTAHAVPHSHRCPITMLGFGGLFTAPCRTCVAPREAGNCMSTPGDRSRATCGTEQHSAIPLPPPPVPTPLQVAPAIPAEEPVPTEPARIEPTPAEPAPIEPALSEPAPAEPTPAETTPKEPVLETPTESTFVPPRNVVPKKALPKADRKEAPSVPQQEQPPGTRPLSSKRLVPTQIRPAEPPPGLPGPDNELRQNTIPINPSKGSTNGGKGNVGSFLYEMLVAPR